jgi:hypothetical protein
MPNWLAPRSLSESEGIYVLESGLTRVSLSKLGYQTLSFGNCPRPKSSSQEERWVGRGYLNLDGTTTPLPNLPSTGWLPKLRLDLGSEGLRAGASLRVLSTLLPRQSTLAIEDTTGWEVVKSSLLRKSLVLNILLVREQSG